MYVCMYLSVWLGLSGWLTLCLHVHMFIKAVCVFLAVRVDLSIKCLPASLSFTFCFGGNMYLTFYSQTQFTSPTPFLINHILDLHIELQVSV